MAFASDKGRQGAAGQGGETSYEISKSLRFNDDDSAYLTLPTSWTPNRKTFTMSFWTKRTFHNTRQSIFSLYNGAKEFQIAFDGTDDNKLIVMEYNSGYVWRLTSSASYRDPSAWLHVVISIDTTQPITSNRVKMYVNGQQITDFETEAYPSLNYDNHIGGATGREMVLGMWGYATWSPAGYQRKFDGYLADVHFLDGHAVNPDTFGEFNKYGQWVAKTPTFANPSFDDGSPSNHKVELNGNVQTTVGKYGQGFSIDGTAYLQVAHSSDLDFSGTFTIEFWSMQSEYGTIANNRFLQKGSNSTSGYGVFTQPSSNEVYFGRTDERMCQFTQDLRDGVWHHIAVTREADNYFRLYLDGVLKDTSSTTYTTNLNNDGDVYIAAYPGSPTDDRYSGSMDDIRLSNTARYTADFTPPTRRLTSDANTKLLLNGDQVTIAEGKFSDGMVFDGTDDYVDLHKTTALLDWNSTNAKWSGSAWVYPTSSSAASVIGKYGWTSPYTDQREWWFGLNGGKIRLSQSSNGTNNNNDSSGVTTLELNKWHHIAFTIDRTLGSNQNKIYLNGALDATITEAQSTTYVGNTPLMIGGNNGGANHFWIGTTKEISLYSSTLSASDITSLYNKGVPKPATDVQESSLEAYYPLNETNGSSVFDNSTNSNHGSVHGAAPSTYGKNGFHLDFNPVDPDALYFDGSNDYVSLATGALDSLNGSSGFSISAFIKVSADTTDDGYYAMGAATGDGDWFWNQRPAGTDFWVAAKTVSGSTVHSIPNPLKGEIGKWVHLVTTYVSGSLKTYKNGVLIDTYTSNTGNVVLGASSGVYLGSYGTGAYAGYWTMQGNMEEVAVYNSGLTQANVEALYNDGNPADATTVSGSSLVGYWKLNEGVGTNVSDSAKWTAFEGATFGGTGSRINSNTDILGNQSDFTIQTWVKPSSSQVNYADILGNHYDDGTTERGFVIQQYAGLTNQYEVGGAYTGDPALNWANGSLTRFSLTAGSWQHLVITKSNGGNVRVYINGVLDKNITDSGYSGATQTSPIPFKLGEGWVDNQRNFNGQLKEFAIWHTVLTAANVTSLYNSGTPIDATDISGTKMYWKLDEGPSQSGNGYVKDSSGENKGGAINIARFEGTNHNNGTITGASWTVANVGNDKNGNNNFTLNNLGIEDQVLDTPSNNFATLNPLSLHSSDTLYEGNTKVSVPNTDSVSTTMGMSSGKWYAEVYCVSGVHTRIGIINDDGYRDNLGATPDSWSKINNPARLYHNGSTPAYGAEWDLGQIAMVAFDADAGKMWYGVNGTWDASGNPSTAANPSQSSVTGNNFHFAVASGSGTLTYIFNFGQDSSFAGTKTAQGKQDSNDIGDFYYTPPTGFLALCTKNLPEPTVIPSEHFNTVLWNGTSNSTLAITDVGFKPDFVWIKSRSTAYGHNHALFDSVRGISKGLVSNSTNIEYTVSGVTSFDSDGFTLGSDNAAGNEVGFTYAGWNWKAGTAASGSTTGSGTTKTYTASYNAKAGFSIIGYTGNGTAGHTIPHHLDYAPEMVLIKQRSTPGHHWKSIMAPLGAGKALYLNLTNSEASGQFDNTLPTSSVFTLDSDTNCNELDATHIAYAFHSVDGYSKVGTYTGNGSDDGTFVYTGFKPAYVMTKKADGGTGNWTIIDTARSNYNIPDDNLQANTSNGEFENTRYDILSNGIKLRRGASGDTSTSGHTYIFIAFAETPFKYSNAR